MKIMLDTNVIISALIFGGKAGKLLELLFDSEHELYVSDYIDKEFWEKLRAKWPDKAEKVYSLYRTLDIQFCKSTKENIENTLRDKKDVQVLCDALYYQIDVILTGDKDFLEAKLDKPLIYSPGMMFDYLSSE